MSATLPPVGPGRVCQLLVDEDAGVRTACTELAECAVSPDCTAPIKLIKTIKRAAIANLCFMRFPYLPPP